MHFSLTIPDDLFIITCIPTPTPTLLPVGETFAGRRVHCTALHCSVWQQQMEPAALEHSGEAHGTLWGALRLPTVSIFFVNQLLAVLFYISPVPVSARLMAARTLSSVKDCFLISLTPHLCDSRVRKILAVFIENLHS